MKMNEWAKLGAGVAVAKLTYSAVCTLACMILEGACKKFDAQEKEKKGDDEPNVPAGE